LFIELKDGWANLEERAIKCAQKPSNLYRLHLVHGLDPRGLDGSDGLGQIKNILASL
jgi:hypothetical protein